MTSGIFLIQDDDRLVEMNEQPYDTEDLLQGLLAKYPNLIAGDQIDAESPRRWLLVKREMGIPSQEDGGGRWSVDHLFLDQDAIPTLIEVKRSSDTRIRREVVGQMLDYAANAVVYWPVEEMRFQFEKNCESRGVDPRDELVAFLGDDGETDEFWQKAKTNLQAGKIRMLFVADVIPPELKRIVEFLNEQMDPAEILAVEIRQFSGRGMRTLVPRVFGQTQEAEKRKGGAKTEKRQWDEDSFFKELAKQRNAGEVAVARTLLDWARKNNVRVLWGQGNKTGSFTVIFDDAAGKHHLFAIWTEGGKIEFSFQHFLSKAPFTEDADRFEVLNRFRAIPGVDIPTDAINRRPSVPLSAFEDDAALKQVLGTFDWVLEKIKAS